MTNVISLMEVRRAREVLAPPAVPLAVVVERALDYGTRMKVSPGATILLLRMAHLMEMGHKEMSYTYLCRHLGSSTSTLARYMEELEDHKMLRIRRSRIGKIAATNQFEIDFKGPLGDPAPMLKLPKNFNELGTPKMKVPGRGVLPKAKSNNINIKSNIDLIPKGIGRASPPRFETVSEALEFSSKRIVRKRAEKVDKATKRGGHLTLAGVKATWATSMLKHYPSVPPVSFTGKDFAILKGKLQPLLAVCNLSEVFDYFVSSWRGLRETKFIWLRVKGKDISIAPSLPELMRYWKIFSQAFSDSRMAAGDNTSKATRTELEDLQDELALAKAARAIAESEQIKLRERAAKAERVAYGPASREAKPASLSARRKALDESYNDETPLPEWK